MITVHASAIVTCLLLGIGIGAAAFTIARTKISAPFRAWVTKRSTWFGSLVSCPYCLSHWLAFAAIAIYRPRPVAKFLVIDWGVAWFLTVAVAALMAGVVSRSIAAMVPPAAPPPPPRRGDPLGPRPRVSPRPIPPIDWSASEPAKAEEKPEKEAQS